MNLDVTCKYRVSKSSYDVPTSAKLGIFPGHLTTGSVTCWYPHSVNTCMTVLIALSVAHVWTPGRGNEWYQADGTEQGAAPGWKIDQAGLRTRTFCVFVPAMKMFRPDWRVRCVTCYMVLLCRMYHSQITDFPMLCGVFNGAVCT